MKHLRENNETYLSHLIFAHKVALHLCLGGVCLIVHGIFPCWNIPESFNLESTCNKMKGWNEYAARRRER